MAAKRKTRLLGPDGEPVSAAVLKEEISAPTLGGVRGTMWDQVATGITPQRLAHVLRAAEEGDHRDYLTLAEEMEERELHYIAVLGTRKRALTGIEVVIEAASEAAPDQKIADAVRDLTGEPMMRELLDHMTDAIGKGFAVSEIIWETSAREWRPLAYRDRDPRHFMFDRLSQRELRLIDTAVPDGVPLAPFKFVRHVPRLKSGIPIRSGLAKPAAWAFIFKGYTLKDWMAFCEVYGMPLRIGRYGPQATEEDRRRLLAAVRNIGTDAAAIVPEGMAIEFAEVKGGNTRDPVFSGFAQYIDAQLSKLVLGQTMTTDNGASMAQAKVHEHVRLDILAADARQLEATVNRDIIKPFVDLNFGPQKKYPRFMLPVESPEDLKTLAENVKALAGVGVRISEGELRDRFGFSDPDIGEIVVGQNGLEEYAPVPADDAEEDEDAQAEPLADDEGDDPVEEPAPARNKRARNSRRKGASKRPRKAAKKAKNSKARGKKAVCKSCGVAHNEAEHDDLDTLTDDTLSDWEQVVDPMLKPLRDLVLGARDYDAFLKGLPKAMEKMDPQAFISALAASMAIARGIGDARA
jgi:phage gp29-like protein